MKKFGCGVNGLSEMVQTRVWILWLKSIVVISAPFNASFTKRATPSPQSNIDSFFNKIGQEPFSSGIIISTTENWSGNAENALKGRTKPCVRLSLEDLKQSSINWAELYEGKRQSLANKQLRDHQKVSC